MIFLNSLDRPNFLLQLLDYLLSTINAIDCYPLLLFFDKNFVKVQRMVFLNYADSYYFALYTNFLISFVIL